MGDWTRLCLSESMRWDLDILFGRMSGLETCREGRRLAEGNDNREISRLNEQNSSQETWLVGAS